MINHQYSPQQLAQIFYELFVNRSTAKNVMLNTQKILDNLRAERDGYVYGYYYQKTLQEIDGFKSSIQDISEGIDFLRELFLFLESRTFALGGVSNNLVCTLLARDDLSNEMLQNILVAQHKEFIAELRIFLYKNPPTPLLDESDDQESLVVDEAPPIKLQTEALEYSVLKELAAINSNNSTNLISLPGLDRRLEVKFGTFGLPDVEKEPSSSAAPKVDEKPSSNSESLQLDSTNVMFGSFTPPPLEKNTEDDDLDVITSKKDTNSHAPVLFAWQKEEIKERSCSSSDDSSKSSNPPSPTNAGKKFFNTVLNFFSSDNNNYADSNLLSGQTSISDDNVSDRNSPPLFTNNNF